MKVFFLSNTGHAYIDYVNSKYRLVEFRDGYHTITNDAIWKTGDRDGEAVMYVWQGRSSPEGQCSARVRFVMKETNRLKDNRQPIRVSRLWHRYFIQGLRTALWILAFVVTGYISYIIYYASRLN